MKLKPKYTITTDEADKLIENYYEGLTTAEEEKRLHAFLSQPGLPQRYAAEQAIFGYFNAGKSKTKAFRLRPYLSWAGSAAAILVIAVGIQFFGNINTSYAYVDGVKITNINQVKAQAIASLNHVSADNDEVKQSLEAVTGNEIIKEQLDVFSGLGE
ncbi:MAG: hypothetical protein H6Q20_498 [Bacteroidetes bacterium]|nr:hypothetical protein [Bacteroidota bacterium]